MASIVYKYGLKSQIDAEKVSALPVHIYKLPNVRISISADFNCFRTCGTGLMLFHGAELGREGGGHHEI